MIDLANKRGSKLQRNMFVLLATVSCLIARKRGSEQRVLVHGIDAVGPLSDIFLIGIMFPLCET